MLDNLPLAGHDRPSRFQPAWSPRKGASRRNALPRACRNGRPEKSRLVAEDASRYPNSQVLIAICVLPRDLPAIATEGARRSRQAPACKEDSRPTHHVASPSPTNKPPPQSPTNYSTTPAHGLDLYL